MHRSDSKTVVLRSVSWRTSGTYRCEVSAEAPSFTSAQSEARMEVVGKFIVKTRDLPVALRLLECWGVISRSTAFSKDVALIKIYKNC